MNRIKASLSHFLLSVSIFSIVIFVLIFYWFPAPYFNAGGGWQGLKIVAGVDLVLGPLLTLIIFDIKKTRTKLVGDLIVIAALQFSALAWGVTTIYNQRPVAVVFFEQSFLTVPAESLTKQGVDISSLKQFSDISPPLIYAKKPKDIEELMLMAKLSAEQALPPHHQINLYRSLAQNYDDVRTYQVDINQIITANNEMKSDLMVILSESNTTITDYDYFPLRSKYYTIILMFTHDGELVNHIVVPLRKPS
ncbi:MAG: hypothetical protein COA90_04210 [Gammaproteobacteria bacterium]|nr:MAG: hypothetical protein COA90_04210 [Gammaproteobacteria bacterium]